MQKFNAKTFLKKRLIPIIFSIFVFTLILLPQRPLNERIDYAILIGKSFAANQDVLKDILSYDYSMCIKDFSECSVDNYTIFYKKVDIYLDFVYLKSEPIDVTNLEKKISEADGFLKDEILLIPNLTTDYSYFDSTKPLGQIAMDTTCILGWTYNDTSIYLKMKKEMKSYGWADPNTADPFRKLIDETWCISLLAQNNEDKISINHLVNVKKDEFYAYINGSDYLDRKIISGVHILLMFDRLNNYGYDISQYSDFIKSVTSYVANETANGSLYYPLEVNHNVLYALAKIHYPDKIFLTNLAEKILKMQNPDGSWSVGTDGRYRILETLRSVIALNIFEKNYL